VPSSSFAEHPDKGGNAERFKAISKAHSILTDPEKRKRYDQFGEEGVDSEGGGGGGGDLFSELFGGGRSRNTGPRRGEDVVHKLGVSLEDLYKGKVRLAPSQPLIH
jgi:DnaJ family protein A protein 2